MHKLSEFLRFAQDISCFEDR